MPLQISVVVSNLRSSPAEPPISGMSSSAQWIADGHRFLGEGQAVDEAEREACRRPAAPAVASASARLSALDIRGDAVHAGEPIVVGSSR